MELLPRNIVYLIQQHVGVWCAKSVDSLCVQDQYQLVPTLLQDDDYFDSSPILLGSPLVNLLEKHVNRRLTDKQVVDGIYGALLSYHKRKLDKLFVKVTEQERMDGTIYMPSFHNPDYIDRLHERL